MINAHTQTLSLVSPVFNTVESVRLSYIEKILYHVRSQFCLIKSISAQTSSILNALRKASLSFLTSVLIIPDFNESSNELFRSFAENAKCYSSFDMLCSVSSKKLQARMLLWLETNVYYKLLLLSRDSVSLPLTLCATLYSWDVSLSSYIGALVKSNFGMNGFYLGLIENCFVSVCKW